MKRFFKKIFTLLIFLAVVAGLYYFCKGWFVEQYHHAKGVYYIYKGDRAYAKDNMAKTLDYYTRGLELYPKHYEAWFNLGNIYAVYEDYFSAVDAYKHAIEHNPKFVMAKMNLGIVYSEDLGWFDDAIEQFSQIPQIGLFNLWIPFASPVLRAVCISASGKTLIILSGLFL